MYGSWYRQIRKRKTKKKESFENITSHLVGKESTENVFSLRFCTSSVAQRDPKTVVDTTLSGVFREGVFLAYRSVKIVQLIRDFRTHDRSAIFSFARINGRQRTEFIYVTQKSHSHIFLHFIEPILVRAP